MDVAFTAFPWLNVILVGFLFGIGFVLAGAVYSALLGVLGRGRAP